MLPQWPCPLDERCWKKFIYAVDDRYPEDYPFPDYWLRLRSVLSVLVAGDCLDAINVRAMNFQSLPDFQPYPFTNDTSLSERRRVTDAWRSEVARRNELDARPYALANPQFKTMPVFGQFRGQDNPEQILSLSP